MSAESAVLKTRSYPKMVEEFARTNFDLKVLVGFVLGLLFLSLCVIAYLVKKGPMVVALDNTGDVARIESKVTDLQIEAAVRRYVSYRYTWDEGAVEASLKKAEFFVLPNLVSSFQKAMLPVIKYAREKKVRQRVYPKSVVVDIGEKKVTIVSDRITEFENLKAATEMRLELQFALSERTVVNPWGVYISRESEFGGEH